MATDLLGDRIDIAEEIGRGAMGVVHRAEMNGQTVAVKILHAHLHSDLTAVGRFVREHQALSRIHHPNVVRLVDLIIDDPRIGIVMEYLDATDLSKLLSVQRLEPVQAVAMAADIAAGVAAIHDAGVVHRDLKPANILIVDGEHPKITDFGVSRLTGQSSSKATTTLGTPLYMSPEAADGSGSIEASADVYSLGVILFELLTGETPFNGDEPIAIAVAHVSTPPPSVAGVPPDLSELITSMLAKDPADRPTAPEVEQRLRAAIDDLGPDTAPVVVAAKTAGTEAIGDRFSSAGANGNGDEAAVDRTVASDATLAPPALTRRSSTQPTQPSPWSPGLAPDVDSAATVGVTSLPIDGPVPPTGSILRESAGTERYYPPPYTTSRSDLGDEPGRSFDSRTFIGLAVLATVMTGVMAFSAFRPDGWLADDVSAVAPDDIAYSFAPKLSANALITTRRWEYNPLTNEVEAEVVLTNTSGEALSGNHYEVLPPILTETGQGPLDFDAVAESFQPGLDDFTTDPLVATIGYTDLGAGQGLTITYRFPAPVGIGAQADLEQLAASQQEAEADFLAGLPSQEEEANTQEAILTRLGVQPDPIRLQVGDSAEVELTGVLSDGTPLEPEALESAVLMVDDSEVAVVDGTMIQAVSPGRAELTVTMGDVDTQADVIVTAGPVGGNDDEPAGPSTTRRVTTSSTPPTTRSTTSTTRSTTTTTATTVTTATTGSTSTPSTTISVTTSPTTVTTASTTTEPTTSSTQGEADLTMSPLSATVRADGSFKIMFATNLCTIANYSGAGQSYITPGWPEVTGSCWQRHGQNFTAVGPGAYTIVVKARSIGGQQAQRSIDVEIN